MSELLTLSGVETHIGRYHILHGVELDVPEGKTTMLLGRNGAGKTTTLRTIMGLWRASTGEIRLGKTGSGQVEAGQVGCGQELRETICRSERSKASW